MRFEKAHLEGRSVVDKLEVAGLANDHLPRGRGACIVEAPAMEPKKQLSSTLCLGRFSSKDMGERSR